ADRVVSWDAAGRIHLLPADPGTRSEPGLVIYRFGVGIFYANAMRLSDEVLGLTEGHDPPRWFVLAADAIDDIDYTGAKTLIELVDGLMARGIVFAVAGARPSVRRELDRYGITAKIGAERFFDDVAAARGAFALTSIDV